MHATLNLKQEDIALLIGKIVVYSVACDEVWPVAVVILLEYCCVVVPTAVYSIKSRLN